MGVVVFVVYLFIEKISSRFVVRRGSMATTTEDIGGASKSSRTSKNFSEHIVRIENVEIRYFLLRNCPFYPNPPIFRLVVVVVMSPYNSGKLELPIKSCSVLKKSAFSFILISHLLCIPFYFFIHDMLFKPTQPNNRLICRS